MIFTAHRSMSIREHHQGQISARKYEEVYTSLYNSRESDQSWCFDLNRSMSETPSPVQSLDIRVGVFYP